MGYVTYRNLIDEATLTLTGGAIAEFPVANLQTRQLGETCRMTAAATPRVNIDLGSAKLSDVIALLNINEANAVAWGVTVEYSSNGIGWSSAGTFTLNDAGVPELPRLIILAHGIDAPYRYWRVTPSWVRPVGVPYYELGRLWLGPAIKAKCAPLPLGFRDAGKLDASAGEQNYEDERIRPRRARLVFSCETLQAYGFEHDASLALDVPSFQGLQMAAGTTGELIAIPRTSSRLWMRRTAIYGHLTKDFTIVNTAGQNYTVDLEIVEER